MALVLNSDLRFASGGVSLPAAGLATGIACASALWARLALTLPSDIPIAVKRRAAAIHEAGHALVAIVLGRRVTGAILRPPHGTSGETQFDDAPPEWLDLNLPEHRRVVVDAIVVLLAGQVAEAEFWTAMKPLYNPFLDTQRDDDEDIVRLKAAFDFDAENDADFMAHCIARTRIILHDARAKAATAEIAEVLADWLSIGRAGLDEILTSHDIV